jgi:hypothetical protein
MFFISFALDCSPSLNLPYNTHLLPTHQDFLVSEGVREQASDSVNDLGSDLVSD